METRPRGPLLFGILFVGIAVGVLLSMSWTGRRDDALISLASRSQDIKVPTKEPAALVVFTDPGVDDLFANIMLAKAAARGDIKILAVVGHFGCTTRENACRHAFGTYGNICPDVPVLLGSEGPSEPPPMSVGEELPHFYDLPGGKTHGLCGLELPAPKAGRIKAGGIQSIVRQIEHSDRPVHLVLLGPATDAAILLQHKEIHSKIRSITMMAGALGKGNCGPQFEAEFNLYLDVKAGTRVLNWAKDRKVPLVMIPWDMALTVAESEVSKFSSEDEWGRIGIEAMQHFFPVHRGDQIPGDPVMALSKGDPRWWITDPKAALWLLKPELCLRVPTRIYVVTERDKPKAYGKTTTSRPDETHEGPFDVHYVIPSQPQIVAAEVFRQLGIQMKR